MISIVIPVWKTLYLARTIESVLEQTYTEFELIIVEGRRLQGFDQIMSDYDDSRIKIYRHDPMPMVENWNRCMGYAKGEFSILMCDDDMFDPEHLEALAGLASVYANVDIFHSRIKIIDNEDGVVDISPMCGEFETAGDFMYQKMRYLRPQFVSDFMYRTAKFRSIGGFVDRPMAWFSDVDTAIEMAIPNGVVFSRKSTFLYRAADENVSSNLKAEQALEAVRQHYDFLLKAIVRLSPEDLVFRELIQKKAEKSRDKAYAAAYTRTGIGRYPFAPLVDAIRMHKHYPVSIARAVLASIYALGQKKNLKA